MKKIPLPFLCFYCLMTVYAAALVSLPFCPVLQRAMMQKFHLRSPSFQAWAFFQFAPSMYGFANEVWLADELIEPRELLSAPNQAPAAAHLWTNHYPFWPVTFSIQRGDLLRRAKDHYVYLRTRFRQQELWTIYHLNPSGRWERIESP